MGDNRKRLAAAMLAAALGLTCVGENPGFCRGAAGYPCAGAADCCSGTCTGGGTCAP